jgi:glycosyltransferase involved in cell wall biosynthesis
MTKVVRIIARLNTGGPTFHVMHLSAGLAPEFDTLLVAGTIADGEGDLTPMVRENVAAVTILPSLGREIHPLKDLLTLLRLYRLLRRERPMIVHTHTAKAGAVGRVAAILARVPVRVHTFHGHVLRGYFGPTKSALFIRLERMLARGSTAVIAVSDSLAAELMTEFRVCEPSRLRVIPLGLDLARYSAAGAAERRRSFRNEMAISDELVVACVGRLVPIKNVALLLDAVAVTRSRGVRLILLIVGRGTEEVRLRERADALGLHDAVRFVGWRSDLDRVYAGADIVALSSDNEGTPVALIEALAAGRSVVATNVGGVRDVLEDGRLGKLVARGDAAGFSDALIELAHDATERHRLELTGPPSVLRRFGKDRLVADIARLYTELIESARER